MTPCEALDIKARHDSIGYAFTAQLATRISPTIVSL